jgi:hypothetical protein
MQEKVPSVLKEVAHRLHKSISYVREVYADRNYSKRRRAVKAGPPLQAGSRPKALSPTRTVKAETFFSKENAEIEASRAESKRHRGGTEIARLATLLPSEYERQREPASKALGMRPAALDIAIKRAQRKSLSISQTCKGQF